MSNCKTSQYYNNALVIGYGSIGARHARILRDMGCDVSIVTRQNVSEFPSFHSVPRAFAEKSYSYVVIATPTSSHEEILNICLGLDYKGLILVEKPLCINSETFSLPHNNNIYVGYNLRFHPIIQELKRVLANKDVSSMHVYMGQHLPDWRPGRDYTKSYSASKEHGGGVIRDLSHELDYVMWLVGSSK